MIATSGNKNSRNGVLFLHSALTETSRFQSTESFLKWFRARERAKSFRVNRIDLDKIDKWSFEETSGDLVHASGRFFRIEGLHVQTNFGLVREWEQPIINQPEIGILGIVTRIFDGVRYFLMQAKMEPGNINIMQLSPTVQATRSNYTQAHKGKLPPYLEYFLDRTRSKFLVDQLQSEQGTRFLRKRNRNMIVEIDSEIEIKEDFCWLTLGQIKRLSTVPNLVNMDSRSVLSCIPYDDEEMRRAYEEGKLDDFLSSTMPAKLDGFSYELVASACDEAHAEHSRNGVLSWFAEQKTRYDLRTVYRPLRDIKNWIRTKSEISHETGRYFSVVGVSVEAGSREVASWMQPLVKSSRPGITGVICQKRNGVLHFLLQARLEPGTLDLVEFAPTVSCTAGENSIYEQKPSPYAKYFVAPDPKWVRYSAMQSMEGGRFYHDQNRYIVLEMDSEENIPLSNGYIWLTLSNILNLLRYSNHINVESREIIACLNFHT